jgi:hypothetical protein
MQLARSLKQDLIFISYICEFDVNLTKFKEGKLSLCNVFALQKCVYSE